MQRNENLMDLMESFVLKAECSVALQQNARRTFMLEKALVANRYYRDGSPNWQPVFCALSSVFFALNFLASLQFENNFPMTAPISERYPSYSLKIIRQK